MFSDGSVPRYFNQDNWSKSSVVEFPPARNALSTEAEESPLLEAVTRKRLVESVTD
jgi:hypothetical protein